MSNAEKYYREANDLSTETHPELGEGDKLTIHTLEEYARLMCEEQKKEDKSFIIGYLSAVNPDLANTFDLTTKNVCDER